MMPVDSQFIAQHCLPDSPPIKVEGHFFSVEFRDSVMTMFEKDEQKIVKSYKILWAMGGHNVYCFLTPLEKGKLQTIPLAYDVNRKSWFNYPESAIRNFGEGHSKDKALPWKDPMFSFNTGCYSCHVSQLSSNFDLTSGTYHTTWREAGINCETCHGPGEEHIRACRGLKEGEVPKDMKLIVTSSFTPQQHNDACAPCHAKMNPITPSYRPGDKFFDNYNITTLEDPDFYPDGRDLGENYTMTAWMMNPCAQKSDLNCITCHTSSGRDRNKDNPNQACVKCHRDKVLNFEAHSRHKPEAGLTCISCHMPKREFVGHFLRSDHSFRPPMPEATIRFGSPNACNSCHTDKSPQWANAEVKKRKNSNYQDETLKWAQLIKEAREQNWKNVDRMYEYIRNPKSEIVVVNSLIRLLGNYNNESKTGVFIHALSNKSELVRASAAHGLMDFTTPEVKKALLQACQDEIRLVRIQAVSAILSFPPESFTVDEQAIIDKAEKEYVTSMKTRLDNWSNHYNLGIYYQQKGNVPAALNAYETASRLYPKAVLPQINSSLLYACTGHPEKAEAKLREVLKFEPKNEIANLNLGLLLAGQGNMEEAELALMKALDANPSGQPVAAKNLSVIAGQRNDFRNAVKYAEIASKAQPANPEYGYTLAFYQLKNRQKSKAITTLKAILKDNPGYINAIQLLAGIYQDDGDKNKALQLYQEALNAATLTAPEKAYIRQMMGKIQP